jgi:hypothetical protein
MERAKEVQGKLSAEHPSFVKQMLHSHVVRGFWLVSLQSSYLFLDVYPKLSIQISFFSYELVDLNTPAKQTF